MWRRPSSATLTWARPNTGEEITDYVTNTLMAFPTETIREYRSYVEKQ